MLWWWRYVVVVDAMMIDICRGGGIGRHEGLKIL